MKVIEAYAIYKIQTTKLPVNFIHNEIKELKVVNQSNIFLAGYEFLRDEGGKISKFSRFKEDETRNLITETSYIIFNRGEGVNIYSLKKTKKAKKGYFLINGENYKLFKKTKPHDFNSIKYKEGVLIYETNLEINKPVEVTLKKSTESDNWISYDKQIENIYSLILDKQLKFNFFAERKEGELFTLFICFITIGENLSVVIKKYNYFSVSTILLFEFTFMQIQPEKVLQILREIEFPMNNSLILEFVSSDSEANIDTVYSTNVGDTNISRNDTSIDDIRDTAGVFSSVTTNDNTIKAIIDDTTKRNLEEETVRTIETHEDYFIENENPAKEKYIKLFKETKPNTINFKINYNILCDIINSILLEKKLILVSKNRNRLFNFITFLLNLIKPFEYSFYILNASRENLEDFVEIPFPYILLVTDFHLKTTNQFIYYLDLNEFDKPKNYKNILPDLKALKKKLRNNSSLKTIFSNYINILINNINIKLEKFFITFMLPMCKNQTKKYFKKNKSLDTFLIEFSKTRIYLSFFKNRNKLKINNFPLKFQIKNQITITPYFLFTFKFVYSIEIEKIILLKFPSKTKKYFERVKHSNTFLSEIFPFVVNNSNESEARNLFNFIIQEGIFFPPESLRLIGDNKNQVDFSIEDLIDYKIYLKKVKEVFKDEEILIEKIFVEFHNKILHEFKIIEQKYFLFLCSENSVFDCFVKKYEIFKWNFILFLCFFRNFNKLEFPNLPTLVV